MVPSLTFKYVSSNPCPVPQDAIDMAVSAHQIANRIPDCGLQLWSSELLANLYGLTEDAVKAAQLTELHSTVSSQIDKGTES